MCGVDTAFGAKITRDAKEALQEVTRMSYNRLSTKKLKTDIDINSTIIVTITNHHHHHHHILHLSASEYCAIV